MSGFGEVFLGWEFLVREFVESIWEIIARKWYNGSMENDNEANEARAARDAVDNNNTEVEVYSTDWCPYCHAGRGRKLLW